MIKYYDHRDIPACYVTDDHLVIFHDEVNWSSLEKCPERADIPGWDTELQIYNLTQTSGGNLPPKGSVREELRSRLTAHLQKGGLLKEADSEPQDSPEKESGAPCNCWRDTDTELHKLGLRLNTSMMALRFTEVPARVVYLLPLESNDGRKLKRGEVQTLEMAHCPFCGVSLNPAASTGAKPTEKITSTGQ